MRKGCCTVVADDGDELEEARATVYVSILAEVISIEHAMIFCEGAYGAQAHFVKLDDNGHSTSYFLTPTPIFKSTRATVAIKLVQEEDGV